MSRPHPEFALWLSSLNAATILDKWNSQNQQQFSVLQTGGRGEDYGILDFTHFIYIGTHGPRQGLEHGVKGSIQKNKSS